MKLSARIPLTTEETKTNYANTTDYRGNRVKSSARIPLTTEGLKGNYMRDVTGHRRNSFKSLSRFNGRKRDRALCILLQKELILVTCAILTKGGIKFSHAIPLTISNGNRTEWSAAQCVIIRVKTKSDHRAAGFRFVYTSMITERIGRHQVLLPIIHENYNFREKNSEALALKEWENFQYDWLI